MLLSWQCDMYIYLVGHFLLLLVSMSAGHNSVCRYSKQQGYQTADCSERKLIEVPKNLRTEIEVLDLSFNLIRELHNDTFACCTSIKLLYLQSNSIYEIESHVFYSLSSMIVLDLSMNVLSELPKNLPSGLRRLFLDANPKLFSGANDIKAPVLPITSLTSLEVLHLSSNKLRRFPQFNGNVPSLIELNITDNPLTELSTNDLAPLCQLKYLHVSFEKLFRLSSATDANKELCECLKLEFWTSARSISIAPPLTCRKDSRNANVIACDTEPTNTTIATYESCLAELSSRKLPYKVMVVSGIVVLLIGIIVLLYVRHRRRQRKKLKRDVTGTAIGYNSRTSSAVKNDNQTLEEKCTNHAFDYRGPVGRSRMPGAAPSLETPV